MPMYEYECEKCGKKFAEILTVSEHDKQRMQCPKCASKQVRQVIEPFTPVTSRKS